MGDTAEARCQLCVMLCTFGGYRLVIGRHEWDEAAQVCLRGVNVSKVVFDAEGIQCFWLA